jgi:hypothetical protein
MNDNDCALDYAYMRLAMAIVVEAGLDIERKCTGHVTDVDQRRAAEFLRSDFARDVLEMAGLSPDKFLDTHTHQMSLFD